MGVLKLTVGKVYTATRVNLLRERVTMGSDGSEAEEEHLEDVDDGAGCTEIWEHLSRRRRQKAEE